MEDEFIKVRCPKEANYYDCHECKLWNKYSFGCENLKDRWGLFPKKEGKERKLELEKVKKWKHL